MDNKAVKKPAPKPVQKIRTPLPSINLKDCGGNASYIYLRSDGVVIEQLQDVCFARLFISQYDVKAKDKSILKARMFIVPSNLAKTPEELKIQKKYIRWVVRRSPFRFAFKNTKRNIWKYGIDLDCSMPHPYVVAACIAVRESWEFSHRKLLWNTLLSKKCSTELAYYVSSSLDSGNGLTANGHAVLNHVEGWSSGTVKWFSSLTKEEILQQWPKPMTQFASGYNGASAWFSLGRKGVNFSEHIKPVIEQIGVRWNLRTYVDFNNPNSYKLIKELDYVKEK